jgi:hypothetical protein
MIIDFNKEYSWDDFDKCVLCGEDWTAIAQDIQPRCKNCKFIIRFSDNSFRFNITNIWLDYDYEGKTYIHIVYKDIFLVNQNTTGDMIKRLPMPKDKIIDLDKTYIYKLLM